MGKIGLVLAAGVLRGARAVPALLWNIIGLTGMGLIAYGAWLIYQPAGFLAGGVLLLGAAVILAPRDA